MIIPYRVKNPPSRFPVATAALIAINVIVFAMTSEHFLVVKRSVVDVHALRWGVSAPSTVFTSMFLHGDIFHLLGNMLFLWVFGPAVEDRVRMPGYVGIYLLTGFAGSVAHATLGIVGADILPTLGASGCIMGVLGAYWYLFPWSTVCLAYLFWLWIRIWYGVLEVAAVWVVGAYFAMDLFYGCFYKAAEIGGGVANFAHVGGAFTGALVVWALNVKRDSQQVSRARATHAEVKNLDLLAVWELKDLVAASPDDEDMLVRFANKARESGTAEDIRFALRTGRATVVTNCPLAVVHYLLVMHGQPDLLLPADLLYLGRWCEHNATHDQALWMYGAIKERHPDSRELEMALARSANINWYIRHEPAKALADLDTLLARFPRGTTVLEAEDLRDAIVRAVQQRRAA